MITRRALLGTGVVAAAAGIGAAVAGLQPRRRPPAPPAAPRQLSEALAREQSLIANVDALDARPGLRQVRDDHAAHATALRQAIAHYPAPAPPFASASPPPAAGTTGQLRAAELAAARAAAAESAALTGAEAALLASISASEATHAELLT
jgi:hypothetical protein